MSNHKLKKILITGGTGYLGSNIINKLKNKYDFILLKRKTSNLIRIASSVSRLQVFDIEDFDVNIAKSLDIDIILHCATHYGRKDSDAINIIESNLVLPFRLLLIIKELNRSIPFINTDTILDKNINAYSLSKNQFKEWMNFFSVDNVFINIQLEHFYGPSDDKTKFVSFLVDSFINDFPSINLTKGEQNRYFTYIDDIIDGFEIIFDKSNDFNLGVTEFQISNDEPVNIRYFVEMVKKIACNNTTILNFGVVPYRLSELMNFSIDITAIKNLGWIPKTSLKKGLKKTIEIDRKKL